MREKLIDDLTGFLSGAAGMMAEARQQVKNDMKSRVTQMVDHFDLVPRADFDALEARVKALEARLAPAKTTATANPAAVKPTTSKPAAAKAATPPKAKAAPKAAAKPASKKAPAKPSKAKK